MTKKAALFFLWFNVIAGFIGGIILIRNGVHAGDNDPSLGLGIYWILSAVVSLIGGIVLYNAAEDSKLLVIGIICVLFGNLPGGILMLTLKDADLKPDWADWYHKRPSYPDKK